MKVIDLLNKIANGEEVPKKIKIYRITFELEYDEETESNYYMSSIDGELLNVICASVKELNEEIEIIEEDKPIEKLGFSNMLVAPISLDSLQYYINDRSNEVFNKINELVEEINKLKGGKKE